VSDNVTPKGMFLARRDLLSEVNRPTTAAAGVQHTKERIGTISLPIKGEDHRITGIITSQSSIIWRYLARS
jgi:hypothetical protein